MSLFCDKILNYTQTDPVISLADLRANQQTLLTNLIQIDLLYGIISFNYLKCCLVIKLQYNG